MKNDVIVLKQKPIISYDLVEQKGKEVRGLIASLNLNEIEPTEDSLKTIKSTRTSLSKEFKIFEDQRKMVKELIMKPYNDFDEAYKKHISTLFKDADETLKSLASTVDSRILDKKIVGIREYFMDNNTREWISFEDLGLHIIKSKSDKSIKEEIDAYLDAVKANLKTIDTLDNRERVLAKFQMCKDLNRAISETNLEIQREQQIKAQNEERARLQAEQKQAQEERERVVHDEVTEGPTRQSICEPELEEPVDEKIYKTSFTVYGTKEQFKELKEFMQKQGVRYE